MPRGMTPYDQLGVQLETERRMAGTTHSLLIATQAHLAVALQALDVLGVALAGHNHRWTDDERALYEQATERRERDGQ